MDLGKCCYCGEECNINSQSCGYCAKKMTNYYLGNYLPPYLDEQRFTEEELGQIKEEIKDKETKKIDNK